MIKNKDLESYPRLSYDQGLNNSFYFSEEPRALEQVNKSIIVQDGATLLNILIGLNGYTIATGKVNHKLDGDNIISIPLNTNEVMDLIHVYSIDKPMKEITKKYLNKLKDSIEN